MSHVDDTAVRPRRAAPLLVLVLAAIAAPLVLTAASYAPWPIEVNWIALGLLAGALPLWRRAWWPLASGLLLGLAADVAFFTWLFRHYWME